MYSTDALFSCGCSGERLNVSSDVHMVFEVLDLDQASPATVSRCGMVYMEQVHVGLETLIETWNKKRRKSYAFVSVPLAGVGLPPLVDEGGEGEEGEAGEEAGEAGRQEAEGGVKKTEAQEEEEAQEAQPETQESLEGGKVKKQKHKLSPPSAKVPENEEDNVVEEVEMTEETDSAREERNYKNESMDRLVGVLKRHLSPILTFVASKCESKWPMSPYQCTSSVLRLLDVLLDQHGDLLVQATLSAQKATCLDHLLVWAITWSIGACLEESSRLVFNDYLVQRLQEHESMLTTFDTSSQRTTGTLFDVSLSMLTSAEGTMGQWDQAVERFEYVPSLPFASLFVPTVESVRLNTLFGLLVQTSVGSPSHSVLCVGSSGVGKSVILQRYLSALCVAEADDYESTEIALSAQTSSHILQSVFENKLEKLRKTLLGPSRGRRMVLFVDDLNMPKPDEYGSQPPLELLRQVIDNGGFYDRNKLFWKQVQRVSYVAACGPAGGGR